MAVSGHKSLAEVERYIPPSRAKASGRQDHSEDDFYPHSETQITHGEKSMKYPLDGNALRFRGNDTDLVGYDGSTGTVEPSCAASPAGLSETDSPQPQALVWFGLLNTKPERMRSVR